MEDLVRLKDVPLFADLHKGELEQLARIIGRVTYPAGARIFSEGEAGDAMYVIISGRIRISRQLPGMGEEALAILGPSAVFGEMAVLDGGKRSADAFAQENVRLLRIAREDLQTLLFVNKELAYYVLSAMLRTLAGRLRDMDEKLMAVFMISRFC